MVVSLQAAKDGLLITRAKYAPDEHVLPTPSIKICATASLSKRESEKAAMTIKAAFARVLLKRKI